MLEISTTAFQEQWPALLDKIQLTHEAILITQAGKPVAKLIPLEEPAISCFDAMIEGLGAIENGPEDLSINPEYMQGYGL